MVWIDPNPRGKKLVVYEEDYWSLLEGHIEKHLSSLGAEKKEQS
jgi:hypothetical protein